MIEDYDLDPLSGLPPDLADLDAELRELRVAERSSFSPELKAELERQWVRQPVRSVDTWSPRRMVAAAVGAFFLVGLAVPPARASLAELSMHSLRLLGVVDDEAPAAVEALPATVSAPMGLVLEAEAREEPAHRRSPAVVLPPGNEPVREGLAPAPVRPAVMTFPELVDREGDQVAIRKYYPEHLQTAGIGGVVKLRMWVDSTGAVDDVRLARGSGRAELDRAAILAGRELRWVPATRSRVPVGTWVEFEMHFDPRQAPPALPQLERLEEPRLPWDLVSELPPVWSGESVVPSPIGVEARDLLRLALEAGPELMERLGSLESLLEGSPPAGASPLTWRADATTALQRATARDPDNPAPYLALARIRQKQGLHPEARTLLEKGIDRARRGARPTSPQLVAELNYELGLLLQGSWLGWRGLGRIQPAALDQGRCAGAPLPTEGDDWGVVEVLIGWNFLCPAELDRVLGAGFEAVMPPSDVKGAALEAFEAAVAAHPAHRGANVALMLDLADDERWYELLNHARRFAHASERHPSALLMSGLALHRIGWPEEALEDFEKALRRLPEAEVARLRDPRVLMTADQLQALQAPGPEGGPSAATAFWDRVDPVLTTPVNEREVEHLARAAYATLRFGGLETDASMLWLRYGRPAHVRTLGAGTALRTEFWDYGEGPDVTFRRPAISADLKLTPEARAYVDDLREVFPQWYGNRARTVSALPAQVARFRGEDPRDREVQVHTSVPEAFATGGADSLDLAVVVQDADGRRLARTALRVPAQLSIIRLPAVRAREGADRVVVELFHPGLSQVVGVRVPLVRQSERGAPMRASDLLLTAPPRGVARDAPHRTADAVDALTANQEITDDRLGLLFELYDLPSGAGEYRMWVTMHPESGQDAMPVPIRTAESRQFLEAWSRSPGSERDRVVEHLTLDLEDLPRGDYQLRLTIEVPGSPAIVLGRRVELR